MSDQSIVEVDVSAAKACWNALADADNDWDALSVDEQVAISESFARHRIAEREACAVVADAYAAASDGFDTGDDAGEWIAAAIRARS